VIEKVHSYVREQGLIKPGDRIAAAVSGGADSVALLRALLELRGELGIVLAVAHFNHQIRGAEAEADEQFVRELARQFDLEFHSGSGDVPVHARENKLSLETAARELRHRWFAKLLADGKADKIATAHTEDDQAETVLMRVVRGTGTRGLASISPVQQEKKLIRPFLAVTRKEVEGYLQRLQQPWREDSSNQDLHHARNRVRHELLPLLQQEYNPAIRQTLADFAEIARAEEEFWEKEVAGLFTRLVRSGRPSRSGRTNRQQGSAAISDTLSVECSTLQSQPLALQRRLLRAMGEHFGVALEFKHVQELLLFVPGNKAGRELDLPGDLVAGSSFRELQLSRRQTSPVSEDYLYSLPVPGEVQIPELGATFRAHMVSLGSENRISMYNSALLLDRTLLAPELAVRNWRAGDRYFPAHSRSPRKVKELLQAGRLGHKIGPVERKLWPVIESAGEIVWLRGFPAPEAFAAKSGPAVLIEELEMGPDGKRKY
jgi:tRNA(Ile)-lysidine synthase